MYSRTARVPWYQADIRILIYRQVVPPASLCIVYTLIYCNICTIYTNILRTNILYNNILTYVAGRRCGVEAKLGSCARRACQARLAQGVPNGSAWVQLPLVHGGFSVQWRGHGGKIRSLLALLVQKYKSTNTDANAPARRWFLRETKSGRCSVWSKRGRWYILVSTASI